MMDTYFDHLQKNNIRQKDLRILLFLYIFRTTPHILNKEVMKMSKDGLRFQQVLKVFPFRLRQKLAGAGFRYELLQEIRLRAGKPLLIRYNNRQWFLKEAGELIREREQALCIREEELGEMMQLVSGYSLYAYEEELRQGFLTVVGGHRIGVAGKIIVENGWVKGIRCISGIHVRLAHEVPGCGRGVMPKLVEQGRLQSTLILSPPGAGKTTLLRDLIRMASDGTAYLQGQNVGVVDERSELAGCYEGIAQNDLGMRTDVLDCCPKAQGMMMLLRSMAPSVIAVDEIGSIQDVEALEQVQNCGCTLLATAHGTSYAGLQQKQCFHALLEKQLFSRIVVLRSGSCGMVEGVYDGKGREVV